MSPQNPSSSINNDSNQPSVPAEEVNKPPSNSIPTNVQNVEKLHEEIISKSLDNINKHSSNVEPLSDQDGEIHESINSDSPRNETSDITCDELCELNRTAVTQNDAINNLEEGSANTFPEGPSPLPSNGSSNKGEVPDLINYCGSSQKSAGGDSDSKETTAPVSSQRSPHYGENLDEIIWHPLMDEESTLNLEYKSHINNIQSAESKNAVHTRASSLSTIQLSSSASGVDNENFINYISYENNAKNDIFKHHEEGLKAFDDEICKHRRRRNNRQSLSSSRGCWVFKSNIFSTLYRRLSKWRKGRRDSSFSNINAPLEGINILSNSVDGKICEDTVRATTNQLPAILPRYSSTLSLSSSENSASANIPNKAGKYSIRNKVSTSGVKIIPLEKQAPKIQEFTNSDATSSRTSSETDELNNSTSNNRPNKSNMNMSIKSRFKNRRKHVKEQQKIENDLGSSSSCDSSKDPKSPQMSSRGHHIKAVRTKRLMKEFGALTHISESSVNPIFSVSLINDCLYEWKVKLYRVDPDSLLHRDMVEYGVPFILFNMSFPSNFPFQPPFLRVISPKIEKGFVMEGGAICMELLTPKGWASAYTVEAVIMQLAASLVKGHGRINRHSTREFNKKVAEASFRSLVRTHDKYGWVTPPLAEG